VAAEILQVVEQAGPYLTAALLTYGNGVLGRAQDAAVEATANVGHTILNLVWHRGSTQERAALQRAVDGAAGAPEDRDATGALRMEIQRVLAQDAALLRELIELLPASTSTVNITASGTRSIAAHTIGTAVTGNSNRVTPTDLP
jgi:hypothetical protein